MCEFIALGMNNKLSLINAYAGDILVKRFPARLALAFYVEVVPQPGMPKSLTIQVMQNKKTVGRLEAEFELESGKIGILTTPQIPLNFDKKTNLRLMASCDGFKPTLVMQKTVSASELLIS